MSRLASWCQLASEAVTMAMIADIIDIMVVTLPAFYLPGCHFNQADGWRPFSLLLLHSSNLSRSLCIFHTLVIFSVSFNRRQVKR